MIHDKDNHRFVLTVDGDEVVTRYRMLNDETIEFYSTHTPQFLRGQGYATTLVKHALAYARENNLKVIPTCWYVKKILDQEG